MECPQWLPTAITPRQNFAVPPSRRQARHWRERYYVEWQTAQAASAELLDAIQKLPSVQHIAEHDRRKYWLAGSRIYRYEIYVRRDDFDLASTVLSTFLSHLEQAKLSHSRDRLVLRQLQSHPAPPRQRQ